MSDYIGPSEAARRLGVSAATVRDWLAAGKLTGLRTGIGGVLDAPAVERLAAERAARLAHEYEQPCSAAAGE
jgi:excisionase family DNA binding protein